jgi:radical SAM protein with 4Fe4S-binding SPASM domain
METLERLGSGVMHMSAETFRESLDFLQRSGIPEARILGGEPTIHPRFEEMVDEVFDRGLRLLLFSGGMMPERAIVRLERVPAGQVSVLVNVIAPWENNPAGERRQAVVYRRLGARVTLGLNIASPSTTFDFLIGLVEQYGLARRIRLGLAHPIAGGSNEYLHPNEYPEVGRRVALFGMGAKARGIELEFDCGWVPCMFPEGALRALGKGKHDVGLRCNPILDVLPDGDVISCYPLASHARIPLTPAADSTGLRDAFTDRQRTDRAMMLYKKCDTCAWRARGECTGGCLAGSMRRLRRSEAPAVAPAAGRETQAPLQLTVRRTGAIA